MTQCPNQPPRLLPAEPPARQISFGVHGPELPAEERLRAHPGTHLLEDGRPGESRRIIHAMSSIGRPRTRQPQTLPPGCPSPAWPPELAPRISACPPEPGQDPPRAPPRALDRQSPRARGSPASRGRTPPSPSRGGGSSVCPRSPAVQPRACLLARRWPAPRSRSGLDLRR